MDAEEVVVGIAVVEHLLAGLRTACKN